MQQTILFIGAGNMATSLIGGLIQHGSDPASIIVNDVKPEAMQNLADKYAIRTCHRAADVLSDVDVVLLAVKPQQMREVCKSLAPALTAHQPLFLSIAAGIRIRAIATWLQQDVAIIRAMPNTPALIQCGASALFANATSSAAQRQWAEAILAATGIVVWVDDEAQLDTVTALSGSGPAYFFRIMEGLTKSATALGLSPDTARLLTLQTALGAARMANEDKNDVSELRRRVTSPGGTTERGLQVLEDNAIDSLMTQVLQAAQQRSVELADQLGED